MTKSKRHYIADEGLGGIDREFVETDREADVGDYIVGISGAIYKANIVSEYGTVFGEIAGVAHRGDYKTLSPTDIIRHNGERYRLVDRKAEEGDKVLYMFEGKSDGTVVTVTHLGSDSIEFEEYEDDDGTVYGFSHGAYVVLKPVTNEQETDAPTESQPDLEDLIIRLSRKVAELEKTANNADYKAGQALTTAELQAEKLRDYLETPTPYAEQSELIETNGDLRRLEAQVGMLADERAQPCGCNRRCRR